MGTSVPVHAELSAKITRLIEERGWNLEDFARISNLNRLTVRQIVQTQNRKLRNATIQSCAHALGLTVSELRSLPLERLLPRMRGQAPVPGDERLKQILEAVTQPELASWVQRNEARALQLSASEIDELIAMQGEGGPLATVGVGPIIDQIERKRELLERVRAIAGTEYLDFLEKLVALLYDKIRV